LSKSVCDWVQIIAFKDRDVFAGDRSVKNEEEMQIKRAKEKNE
jgi:hypothetical protein